MTMADDRFALGSGQDDSNAEISALFNRGVMADPTDGAHRRVPRFDFDRPLLLQFRGSTVTSDARLMAHRELNNTPSLTDTGHTGTSVISRRVDVRSPRRHRCVLM